MPEMIKVESSLISEVGYNPETNELVVVFAKTGRKYAYDQVPQGVFKQLMEAKSLGRFFMHNIRENFKPNEIHANQGE